MRDTRVFAVKMTLEQKRDFFRGNALACGSLRPTLKMVRSIAKELRKDSNKDIK